jgi:ribosomal protein S18 acetylase RimI-like enzyme
MRMALDPPVDPGPVPAGVALRPSVEGDDDVGIWETLDEAFADHFGYVRVPFDLWWSDLRSSGSYRPELLLVAESSGRIVGVASQIEAEDLGWVGELGVRPEAQGRGIGRALLRHTLADLAARGFRIAQLNVDAGNERGAPRLYASVGMHVHREWHVYEKPIVGEG